MGKSPVVNLGGTRINLQDILSHLRVIKSLRSLFALVLSGTPLENRLDELYSVVEFIDDRRLGPAFRFYNRYRVTDEKGKVLGYKNLDDLRERLQAGPSPPDEKVGDVRTAPADDGNQAHSTHRGTVGTSTRPR